MEDNVLPSLEGVWKCHRSRVDFISNFRNEGFKFDDIDAVFVIYDHQDHTNDVERILTLQHEVNDRNRNGKVIEFFMNRSSLLKYIHLFTAKNELQNLHGLCTGDH